MANYENEMREVADWLKHPNELGKAPFKRMRKDVTV